jgi:PPIC-type PPIASE domain
MRAVTANPRRGDEELYHEAVALGLDDDVVIQRLLRQKMRLLLQHDPNGTPLREQDILQYVERHRDRFVQPATVTFSHVFLSARARGGGLQEEAEAVLAYLRARSLPPEATDELSDPFPLGRRFQAHAQSGVGRAFGDSFAAQVFELEPQTWTGPIASPFGRHLVWVHERVPERLPSLDAVWQQVAYAVLEERAAARLASGLQQLRRLYSIRVEIPDDISAVDVPLTGGP